MLRLIVKACLALAGVIAVGVIAVIIAYGWSLSNREQANGQCSSLITEKKIESPSKAAEYRQSCMASKGYGMSPTCQGEDFAVGSCFIPKWMFWIDQV